MEALNDKLKAYCILNNLPLTKPNSFEPTYITMFVDNVDTCTYWDTDILGAYPTQAQMDAAYATWEGQQIQAQNTEQAQKLLSATYWTAIASVADPAISNPHLTNQAEFLSYRSAVRAIGVNPPTTPATFPTVPTATWSS